MFNFSNVLRRLGMGSPEERKPALSLNFPNAIVRPLSSPARDVVPFVSPSRPSRREFNVSDFPVQVMSFTSLGHALDSHINLENSEPLTQFAAKVSLPGTSAIAIDLRDCSSSMGKYAAGIISGEAGISNGLKDMPSGHTSLYQIAFNSDIIPLNSSKVVDIKQRFCFSSETLTSRREGDGGLLAGGSQISDALFAGIGIGLAHRKAGFTNPISIHLLTDGWNRNKSLPHSQPDPQNINKPVHSDWEKFSEERARKAITAGREAGITFCMNSFVDSEIAVHRLTSFAKAVGLQQNEIKITMIDSNNPLVTVATAMLDHGTGMSQVLRVRPALH